MGVPTEFIDEISRVLYLNSEYEEVLPLTTNKKEKTLFIKTLLLIDFQNYIFETKLFNYQDIIS